MRYAVLADIHGNSIALDAVLGDIEFAGGVDAYWVLGDLAALGHDPAGVLDRLHALPDATFVRGNTDRYTTRGERPGPTVDQGPTRLRSLGPLARDRGELLLDTTRGL